MKKPFFILLSIYFAISFWSCKSKIDKPATSVKDSVDVIDSGTKLLETYLTAYARDINLVECYTLQSKNSRSRLSPLDLVKLQMMFETPFYKLCALRSSWQLTPMGFSKQKDSLIFNVTLNQVDTKHAIGDVISAMPADSRDTVNWIVETLPVYMDTVNAPKMTSTTRRYLLTRDLCGKLLVNPANGDDFF